MCSFDLFLQLKETRKSECDSESGMKKMAIGHHIGRYSSFNNGMGVCNSISSGDRSHTIERRKNMKTKEQEQHQEFINLDDSEFDFTRISLVITTSFDHLFL